jgi:hypothetical protein
LRFAVTAKIDQIEFLEIHGANIVMARDKALFC